MPRMNNVNAKKERCLKSRLNVQIALTDSTPDDIATALGIHKYTISGWKKGRTTPSLEQAFKLAKFFGCKVDDLWQLIETEKSQ